MSNYIPNSQVHSIRTRETDMSARTPRFKFIIQTTDGKTTHTDSYEGSEPSGLQTVERLIQDNWIAFYVNTFPVDFNRANIVSITYRTV